MKSRIGRAGVAILGAAQLLVAGAALAQSESTVITAAAMDAHNTFDRPDVVEPKPFSDVHATGDTLTATLPAKSVVVLDLS